MKRKFMRSLMVPALAVAALVGITGVAEADSIVWVSNGVSQCTVLGKKEVHANTVYATSLSASCSYGRARAGYYSGGTLKYVYGSYGVKYSVASVGSAHGVATYAAAGGGFGNPGPWKVY